MRLLLAVALASMCGACASKEQIAQYKADYRRTYETEMAAVRPHVTPAHLSGCKKLIEDRQPVIGGRWQLIGPLQPHVKATCVYKHANFLSLSSSAKVAVYVAPVSIGGAAGLLADGRQVEGCAMKLENGVLEVLPGVPYKASNQSPCMQM